VESTGGGRDFRRRSARERSAFSGVRGDATAAAQLFSLDEFFTDVDRSWKWTSPAKTRLRIIRSAALLLQDTTVL
jgi:hypothetical protein